MLKTSEIFPIDFEQIEQKQPGILGPQVKYENTFRMEFIGTYDQELKADARKEYADIPHGFQD